MIWAAFIVALAVGDGAVKKWAEKHLVASPAKEILHGKILLRKLHNPGFALQKGEKFPWIVKIVPMVIWVIGMGCYVLLIRVPGHMIEKIAGALCLGGGASNLWDRWKKGYVTDYFSFHVKWEKLKRIVFNLSDLFIFLGAGLILGIEMFRMRK